VRKAAKSTLHLLLDSPSAEIPALPAVTPPTDNERTESEDSLHHSFNQRDYIELLSTLRFSQ
jgi:hypothetical protein